MEYHKRPSEILGIQDEYTAFCFDEACIFIKAQLMDKKKPRWIAQQKTPKSKNNSGLIDFMKQHGGILLEKGGKN